MKIVAPPTLPIRPVAPIGAITPAARAIPGSGLPDEKGTSSLQVSRFAAALVQHSRILRERELIASRNALQSRAVKLGELYQLLMSTSDTGLDNAARLLRKKLLQDNDADLEQVLEFADGDAAKAHVVLQAARKQAEDDGAEAEYAALTQTLKHLRRRFG
ncbi:type III secretion protein HrpJ, partial [Pseudomonas syringae pv. pisi str. 1704B]